MARARNIKPGFFTNDVLAEVHPLGRLLFAGLWTMADREGRLEDRPKKIKAQILPYDNANVDRLLKDLERLGFIQRYSVSGGQYIQISTFRRHQNPHQNEPPSTIPAPEDSGATPVQEQDKHSSTRADSLSLDSSPLIPDSLTPGLGSPEGATPVHVRFAIEARRQGIDCNGQDPRLVALAERGVTIATFTAACEQARKGRDGQRITLALPLRILESWAEEAQRIKANGATAPPAKPTSAAERAAANVASLTGRNRTPPPVTIDVEPIHTARLG